MWKKLEMATRILRPRFKVNGTTDYVIISTLSVPADLADLANTSPKSLLQIKITIIFAVGATRRVKKYEHHKSRFS